MEKKSGNGGACVIIGNGSTWWNVGEWAWRGELSGEKREGGRWEIIGISVVREGERRKGCI